MKNRVIASLKNHEIDYDFSLDKFAFFLFNLLMCNNYAISTFFLTNRAFFAIG